METVSFRVSLFKLSSEELFELGTTDLKFSRNLELKLIWKPIWTSNYRVNAY